MTSAAELSRRQAKIRPALMKEHAPFDAPLDAWRWRLGRPSQGCSGFPREEGKAFVHVLKTVSPFFEDVASGAKTFEVRRDDRDYRVGDALDLVRYDARERRLDLSVPSVRRLVSYVLRGREATCYGLRPGFCVLGLA